MKCPRQTNGNDCGVSAIANMVSALHGIDPSSVRLNVSAMRIPRWIHLHQGLENKKNTVFPHRKLSFVKMSVLSYRHSNILYSSKANLTIFFNNKMLRLQVLNEINLCCFLIFFSTDHSIYRPY